MVGGEKQKKNPLQQGQAVATARQATEMLNETINYHSESTNESARLPRLEAAREHNYRLNLDSHGKTSDGRNPPNLVPVMNI